MRVFRAIELTAQCSCSRESVEAMLRSFPQSDRDDIVENGAISVTCEFCSETYVFQPGGCGGRRRTASGPSRVRSAMASVAAFSGGRSFCKTSQMIGIDIE